MDRCHACNRAFGLIRHRWWGHQFCTKKCLNDFLGKRAARFAIAIGLRELYTYLEAAPLPERIVSILKELDSRDHSSSEPPADVSDGTGGSRRSGHE